MLIIYWTGQVFLSFSTLASIQGYYYEKEVGQHSCLLWCSSCSYCSFESPHSAWLTDDSEVILVTTESPHTIWQSAAQRWHCTGADFSMFLSRQATIVIAVVYGVIVYGELGAHSRGLKKKKKKRNF